MRTLWIALLPVLLLSACGSPESSDDPLQRPVGGRFAGVAWNFAGGEARPIDAGIVAVRLWDRADRQACGAPGTPDARTREVVFFVPAAEGTITLPDRHGNWPLPNPGFSAWVNGALSTHIDATAGHTSTVTVTHYADKIEGTVESRSESDYRLVGRFSVPVCAVR